MHLDGHGLSMIKKASGLAVAFCCMALGNLPIAAAAPPVDYTLATFADEFNGTDVDLNVWTIDPSRPNVSVGGGNLTLTTEDLGGSWRSGNLWSDFTQRYGYWEASFTIGEEVGLNNAFWLNTPHDLIHEDAPGQGAQTIDRMEIDIQEVHYPDQLNMNLHDWAPTHSGKGNTAVDVGGDLSASFHTYGFEWTTEQPDALVLRRCATNEPHYSNRE